MKTVSLLFASILLITGCSSILPKGGPAPRLYTLNAMPVAVANNSPLPISLKIIKPQTAPGLDTERVALRQNNNQLDYFADVKWAGDASTMLQSLLVENFEATHQLRAVSNDLVTLKNDYSLLVDIRDFQVDYKSGQAAQAHIRLSVTLVNAATDQIVRTFRYEQLEKISSDDMAQIAGAFDKAQQSIMQKLVKDVLANLQVPVAVPSKKK